MINELGFFIVAMFFVGFIYAYGSSREKSDGGVLGGIMLCIFALLLLAFAMPHNDKADVIGDLDKNKIYYVYSISPAKNDANLMLMIIQEYDPITGIYEGLPGAHAEPKDGFDGALPKSGDKIKLQNNKISVWTPPDK